MDIDSALDTVGGYRRFHLTLFCLLSCSSFVPTVFQSISIVFFGWTPPHHCALEANQTKELWIPRKADGSYENCVKYVDVSVDNSTEPCENWHYDNDGYVTMVTEFDLVCEGNYLADVSQVLLMAGCTLTDCICSYFTDRFGRRKIHIITQYLASILGFGVMLAPTYIMIVIFRALVGMVAVVTLNSGLTLMTEFFDSKRRTFAGIGLEFGWVVVYFAPLPFAYFIKDWRWFILVGSLMPLIFLIYHCMLPESPAWLVSYNRLEEAEVVLNKLATCNGVQTPTIHLSRSEDNKTASALKPFCDDVVQAHYETKSQCVLHNGRFDAGVSEELSTTPPKDSKTLSTIKQTDTPSPNGGIQNGSIKNGPAIVPEKCTGNGQLGNRHYSLKNATTAQYSPLLRAAVHNNNMHSTPNFRNSTTSLKLEEHRRSVRSMTASSVRSMSASIQQIHESSRQISTAKQEKQEGNVPVWSLLRDPVLRMHLLMSNLFWFSNAIVYYGLILNAPNYGNRFLTYFIMGVAEIPAYALCLCIVNRFGRRPTIAVFFFFAGISLSVTTFIPRETNYGQFIFISFVFIARFSISGSFAIMVLYLRELFPTDVRSSSVAWSAVGGGVGSVIAPVIAYVGKLQPRLPNLIFGIIALIAMLGVIPLPETTNKPLPLDLHEMYSIYYPERLLENQEEDEEA